MSIRTFVVADTHFGHNGVCQFLDDNGEKIRPWTTPEEMDEALVELWNETVRPADRVFHLGDVSIAKRHVATVSRLHGTKILVKGNHDKFSLDTYTPYFENIHGVHEYDKFLLTHVPVHERAKDRFRGNIHGHLHTETMGDPWFQCVSVEQTGFRPVLLDEVIGRYD
jgi:calcineurin-like phosphoesterase family protein